MLGYTEDQLIGMNLSQLTEVKEFARYRVADYKVPDIVRFLRQLPDDWEREGETYGTGGVGETRVSTK